MMLALLAGLIIAAIGFGRTTRFGPAAHGATPSARWNRSRLRIGTEESVVWGVVSLCAGIVVLGVVTGQVGFNRNELGEPLEVILALWLFGFLVESFGMRMAGSLARLISLFTLLAIVTALASAVLATVAAPYADLELMRIDRLIVPGFDWRKLMLAVGSHRYPILLLSYAYVSLNWQPIVLLFLASICKATEGCWSFLAAWALSLLSCIAVFPFAPALGGYAFFKIAPGQVPAVRCPSAWQYPVLLEHLRDRSIHELGFATLDGIIAMPSFHAAAAVLLGWGFWRMRLVRWPFAILNAAMLVSAVPIGGHYLVDVVAGVAVALLSIAIVDRLRCHAALTLEISRIRVSN